MVIPGQQLSNLRSRFPSLKEAVGRELLVEYIKHKYSGEIRVMLMQSLRMQALLIIFDGVDEVVELKNRLLDIFAEEMVAKRFRFVVTTRPVGIEGATHRFSGSFDTVKLLRLTDGQIQTAMKQQLQGDKFFDHLFAFKHLRNEQDGLYYKQLAPLATTRETVEGLGDVATLVDDSDLKAGSNKYSMPQRALNRFLKAHSATTHR